MSGWLSEEVTKYPSPVGKSDMPRELTCECGRCDTCNARERKRRTRLRDKRVAKLSEEQLAHIQVKALGWKTEADFERQLQMTPAELEAKLEAFDAMMTEAFGGVEAREERLERRRAAKANRKPADRVRIHATMTRAERASLQSWAKANRWTVSELIRALVARAVDR